MIARTSFIYAPSFRKGSAICQLLQRSYGLGRHNCEFELRVHFTRLSVPLLQTMAFVAITLTKYLGHIACAMAG